MNAKIHEIIEKHKQEVEFRTDRIQAIFGSPPRTQRIVRYEIAEKTHAVARSGIHQIVLRTGLYDALNSVPVLMKHHLDEQGLDGPLRSR